MPHAECLERKAPEVLTTPGLHFLVAGEGFEPPTSGL